MAEKLNDPAAPNAIAETAAPPPGILVAGHFTQAYGYQARRSNGTKDWLITFTLSGSGFYRINDAQLRCNPGDIVLLPPGTPHHYGTPEGSVWEFVWAHFLPLPSWSEWLAIPQGKGGFPFSAIHIHSDALRERMKAAFERMILDSLESDFYRTRLSLNAMEEILLLIGQHSNAQSLPPDPRIEQVLSHLNGHMKARHTIERLAAMVALSPSRLSHLFKQQVGESVMETLLRLRLRHSARLLEHTTMQIAEIAEEVGFHSPFYFTKQFTAYYGQSPSHYRKHIRIPAQK